MANVRSSILTALETELLAISNIRKATLNILPIDSAERDSPYVGIVAGDEERIVEDDTNIRFGLDVFLFLITDQQYVGVELLIDDIKTAIYSPTGAIALNANVLDKNILNVQPVSLEDFESDRYSSTRIDLRLLYYAPKSDF